MFQPFLRFWRALKQLPDREVGVGVVVSTLLEILVMLYDRFFSMLNEGWFQPFLRFWSRAVTRQAHRRIPVSTLLEILGEEADGVEPPEPHSPPFQPFLRFWYHPHGAFIAPVSNYVSTLLEILESSI